MTTRAVLKTGTTLGGRYKLTAQIGEGGFGKIFLARQLQMDREVAIKILPPQFAAVQNVVERFRREARLASRLRHPNTITLHDYGQQDDLLYIVMEYLRGEDLGARLQTKTKLPVPQAIHITRQILESLQEAHDLGIIHRDLKPENIFLTHLGVDQNFVKVLDFGIAKLSEPEGTAPTEERRAQLTVQGSTVGTPAYMSPEQAAGDPVTPTSDIYSLGIILFEMLNGELPFDDARPLRVMRAHLFDPVPPFSNPLLRGTVLEAIVEKAMAKEPDQRFHSAAEFLEALERPDLERPLTTIHAPVTNPPPDSAPRLRERVQTTPSHQALSTKDQVPFEAVPTNHQANQLETPPPGFSNPDRSITSSIITVLEEPPTEEIILLTTKKEEPTAPPRKNVSEKKEHEWAWSDDLSAPDASGSQILTDLKPMGARRPLLALIIAIAITLAIAALLAAGGWIPLTF